MKHILTSALLVIMAMSINNVSAQILQKANKEYELYAFNLAIKSYRSVLQSEPTNVEALSNMASCYFHLNEIDEAVQWYKKAVLLKGVKPQTIFNLGLALMNQSNYKEAKKWFLVYARALRAR